MGTRQLLLYITTFLIVCSCSGDDGAEDPVDAKKLEIRGSDMSFLPEVRASGLAFRNSNNQPEDMLLTLKNAGANVIRLRIWKDPEEPTSSLETVGQLADEIKGMGMRVLITVHYSDSWADPGKQTKPAAWAASSFIQLPDSVYDHTLQIMRRINPEYIQIGNEINQGLLWQDGHITKSDQMKQLLQAGIGAVRATNPATQIIMHYAGTEGSWAFFNEIADLDYDIIGLSYYPMWHGKNLSVLKNTLNSLSQTHDKPVFIAETSYPFTLGWNDWTNNIIGQEDQLLQQYPATSQGQRDFLAMLKQIITEVPKGIGFCYWGGEWVSFKGNEATDGSTYENQALWDFENKSLPVLEVFNE